MRYSENSLASVSNITTTIDTLAFGKYSALLLVFIDARERKTEWILMYYVCLIPVQCIIGMVAFLFRQSFLPLFSPSKNGNPFFLGKILTYICIYVLSSPFQTVHLILDSNLYRNEGLLILNVHAVLHSPKSAQRNLLWDEFRYICLEINSLWNSTRELDCVKLLPTNKYSKFLFTSFVDVRKKIIR